MRDRKINFTSVVKFNVNGELHELQIGRGPDDISPSSTLAHVLREKFGLTGTKIGCEEGACGACTVIADGKAILSCMTLIAECHGKEITTIEGLRNSTTGDMHPLQKSFTDNTAFQCGFCTPGIIMSAKALLDTTPSPTEEEIKECLSGNFCRCISHYHVIDAVNSIVQKTEGGNHDE